MAVETKSNSHIKIFLLVFFIFFILIVSLSLLAQAKRPAIELPEGSLDSRVVERVIERPDGSTYKVYLLQTENKNKFDLYNCRTTLQASGTQTIYTGFITSYSEKNCRPVEAGRSQYDCLLENWLHRYQKFNSAVQYRKLVPGSAFEISISNFYSQTTPPSDAFQAKNQLSDIYSVVLNCRTDQGKKVTHTQILRK